MGHRVEFDATAHNVHAVTVFQVDRAEVSRRLAVELKEGQNEVVVTHLPSCLDQDSIRVDGLGAATIFDVVYSTPSPADPSEYNEKMQQLYKQRAALASEKTVLEREITILDQYAGTLNAKDTTAPQLDEFLNFYAEKKTSLNNSLAVLNDRISAVDKDTRDEHVANHADTAARQRGVTITIIVLAEEGGDAELSLSYSVSGASWTPLYDLRARIAEEAVSGKHASSSILLHYRASISQKTGEPWDGVHLTLSTASPQLGTTIPTVRPLHISEEVDIPVFDPMARSRRRRRSPSSSYEFRARRTMAHPVTDDPVETHDLPPTPLRLRETRVAEGVVSATFAIDGLSTIPSDTDSSSQTHKVSIAEVALSNIDLEWVAVPKEVPTVFLQCKVKNTSGYPLLPGLASVYMGNSFVSRSSIPAVSPQEHFTISLGADAAVRVTYHPQQKKVKQPTGSIFSTSSKTSTTSYAQRISMKNTRRAVVPRLVVRDGVPHSTDARINVATVEPRELPSGPFSAGGVAVKEGVRARWVQKNDERPADGDAGDGRLEWICAIPAGGDVDLGLAWDVTSPAGMKWRIS